MNLHRKSFLREYTCPCCHDHRWHDVEILKHGDQYVDLAKCHNCHYATTRYINLVENPEKNPLDKLSGKKPEKSLDKKLFRVVGFLQNEKPLCERKAQ